MRKFGNILYLIESESMCSYFIHTLTMLQPCLKWGVSMLEY
ncbi:hypothetical protein P278_07360 [Zhouia amylolytica AD3]|uniref:Uncharacterized protein n=1 Tax=Zhouia amylolytica AD3 TaxID=1286632 RepID=W2UQS0_9FLAO|nr:hypothetical protein P278_07360 [Zhouia amylolytica AD3]